LIVATYHAVTLVGGGDCCPDDLTIALRAAPSLVAADGGADAVLAAGLRPDAVIGDMDSLSTEARAAFGDILHPVGEQSTTDFEKCLLRIDADLIVALGVMGGRLDHTLAALNTMARAADRRIVVLGGLDCAALVPRRGLRLNLSAGTRLSLMPLGQVTCTAQGLRWPLAQAHLAPDGALSISNEVAQDGLVEIAAEGPLLVTLPRADFGTLVAALRAG